MRRQNPPYREMMGLIGLSRHVKDPVVAGCRAWFCRGRPPAAAAPAIRDGGEVADTHAPGAEHLGRLEREARIGREAAEQSDEEHHLLAVRSRGSRACPDNGPAWLTTRLVPSWGQRQVGLWPPNDWKSFSVSGDFDRIVVGVPFGHSSTVTGSTGTGSAANPSP